VPDTATTPPPAPANGGAITHFLSAVHQALDLPAPRRRKDQRPYLKLLDQRARLARGGIGRLISNPHADALDYASEGDHLRHALADLPPDTYRHHPTGQLLPGVRIQHTARRIHLSGRPQLRAASSLAPYRSADIAFRATAGPLPSVTNARCPASRSRPTRADTANVTAPW
jgi:hypothetical protein